MLGSTLAQLGLTKDLEVSRHFVKAPVFPFVKFPGVDPMLSPEMKSTGEVMGESRDLGQAYFKAMLAAGVRLPQQGTALITVNDRDKQAMLPIARKLASLGFTLAATRCTAKFLSAQGLAVREMMRLSEGRPNLSDAIKNREIDLIINTPLGAGAYLDGMAMRTTAVQYNVPCITTLSAASAAADAIENAREGKLEVISLQEMHAKRT
jgi:carbamoyl-phosphate synthase large subunit